MQEQEQRDHRPWTAWMAAAACTLALAMGPLHAAPLVVDPVEVNLDDDEQSDGESDAPIVDNYARVGGFYGFADGDRNVDYILGNDYGYAWSLGGRNWIEARLATATLETGLPGLTDFYTLALGADYLRTFGSHPDRFFWLAGLGAVANDVTPDEDDGVTGYANLGAGWRSNPWKNWGVRGRLDLRGRYDTFGDGLFDVLLGFSIEILPERVRTVEKVVEKEVVVEKVIEKEVVREVDGDADGDGVPNSRDKCPDTIAGAVVDKDGCVREEQTITLPNIEFEYDKAVLTPLGRERLQPVVRFLAEQADIELEIHGHTDSQGTDAYNLKLSDARAHSVRAFLIEHGIAASRLGARGFGESKPIDTNDTLEGRARNRRVELYIKGQTPSAAATVPGAAPPISAPGGDDADGDGVKNSQDACVDTLRGAKVQPDGCVRTEQSVLLPDLEFEYSRGALTFRGREAALRIVAFLEGQPELRVIAQGYTDSQGTRSFNLWLSDQRAKAVRDFLIENGIAPERVRAEGYGEENPIASNDSIEERAKNRRVELLILPPQGGSQPAAAPAVQPEDDGGDAELDGALPSDSRRPGR